MENIFNKSAMILIVFIGFTVSACGSPSGSSEVKAENNDVDKDTQERTNTDSEDEKNDQERTSLESPKLISVGQNIQKMDPGDVVKFSIVASDPQGVNDLVGGEIRDPQSGAVYASLSTSGGVGSYSAELAWSDINEVRPIEFVSNGSRKFTVQIFDQDGNKTSKVVSIGLVCESKGSACNGECISIQSNDSHCGACDKKCEFRELCIEEKCRPDFDIEDEQGQAYVFYVEERIILKPANSTEEELRYEWGGKNPEGDSVNFEEYSSENSVSFVPMAIGDYQITLSVIEQGGNKSTYTRSITVEAPEVRARFNSSDFWDLPNDRNVEMTLDASESDGFKLSYKWKVLKKPVAESILDEATGVKTQIEFPKKGEYKIQLKVMDSLGQTDKREASYEHFVY